MTTTVPMPDMGRDSEGPHAQRFNEALAQRYAGKPRILGDFIPNECYGENAARIVSGFQRGAHIKVTGVLDAATRERLKNARKNPIDVEAIMEGVPGVTKFVSGDTTIMWPPAAEEADTVEVVETERPLQMAAGARSED